MKSLEELAEKARLAFFDNDTSKCENWNKIGEANKEWWRTVTLAIIREVLGPVTEQEANDAFTTYNKHPSNNDVASFRAALNSIFASRLSHYTRTASPVIGVDVTSGKDKTVEALIETATGNVVATRELPDDEVERVAMAMCARRDVHIWERLTESAKEIWRSDARAAIAAMGGQKRWGVFAMPEGFTHKGVFIEVGINGQTSTTDEALCEDVAKHRREVDKINNEGVTFEVREYTPPAAEIPREAIEAGAKAVHELFSSNGKVDGNLGDENIARAVLTAAIRHLKGGE